KEDVPFVHARVGCRRIRGYLPGLHPKGGIRPCHSVVWILEQASLLKIEQGENEGRDRGQCQNDRPYANSQALLHGLFARTDLLLAALMHASVHSLVDTNPAKLYKNIDLRGRWRSVLLAFHFMEWHLQLSRL